MFKIIFNMTCLATIGLSVAAMDEKGSDFFGEKLDGSTLLDSGEEKLLTKEEKGPFDERLRDHDYYRQELQKLEESTRRIHEEVDRILNEFRRNMEEYYQHTRGMEAITTPDAGIARKAGQKAATSQFNKGEKELDFTEEGHIDFFKQEIAAEKEDIGPRQIDGWELQDVEGKGSCFYDAAAHQMKLVKYSFLGIVTKEALLGDTLRLHIQGEDLKDEEWADDKTFEQFVEKTDDIILAIVDTRRPGNGYVYYYAGKEGPAVRHASDSKAPLPTNKLMIRLATTGNHFLSVVSEPFKGGCQAGIGNINTNNKSSMTCGSWWFQPVIFIPLVVCVGIGIGLYIKHAPKV